MIVCSKLPWFSQGEESISWSTHMNQRCSPAERGHFGEDLLSRRGLWENICACSCDVLESENQGPLYNWRVIHLYTILLMLRIFVTSWFRFINRVLKQTWNIMSVWSCMKICARATCEVTGQLQMNIGVQLSLEKTNRPMSASQISNLTC